MPKLRHLRFRHYEYPMVGIPDSEVSLYIFDLHLRGLVIKAMAVIEHELQLHVGVLQTNRRFVSFGSLRKLLFTKPVEVHQSIALAFGCRNSRELSSLLLNFNEARNIAAHHARLWNRNFHFAIPKRFVIQGNARFGSPHSSNSTAAFLAALDQILQNCPPLLELNVELDRLFSSCPIDRAILLRSMGFDVS